MIQKIRKKMISRSYSKYLDADIIYRLAELTILGLLIGHYGVGYTDFLVGILLIIGIVDFWIWQCLEAINSYDKSVVERNKLINIILSDNCVWDIPVMFGYLLPLAIFIDAKLEPTITIVVMMILTMIVVVFINVMSNFFKSKIIE